MTQATRNGQLTISDTLEVFAREGSMWLLIGVALYLALCLVSYSPHDPAWAYLGSNDAIHNAGGRAGAWFADIALHLVGFFAYVIPLMIVWSAYTVFHGSEEEPETRLFSLALRWVGFALGLIAGTAFINIHWTGFGAELPLGAGGGLGAMIGAWALSTFSLAGATLLLLAALMASLGLVSGVSPLAMIDGVGALTLDLVRLVLKPVSWVSGLFGGLLVRRAPMPDLSPLEPHHVPSALPGAQQRREPRLEPELDETEPDDRFVKEADFAWAEPESGQRSGSGEAESSVLQEETLREAVPQATDAASADPFAFREPVFTSDLEEVAQAREATRIEQPWVRPGEVDDDLETVLDRSAVERSRFDEPSEPAALVAEPMVAEHPEELPWRTDEVAAAPAPVAPQSEPAVQETREPFAKDAFWDDVYEPEARPVARAFDTEPEPETEPAPEPAPSAATQPRVEPRPPAHPIKPVFKHPAHEDERQLDLPEVAALEGLPPLELLEAPRKSGKGYSSAQLMELSRMVEMRLKDFGVDVRVDAVHPGPVVVLFELELAPGTKVSKITGLAKDIARALSTTSVRVVEVIPGKSLIGLEIPNDHRETVYLREVLASDAYQDAKSPLTIAMGTNISGQPVVADLGRMPHALIAGTTGSGKSVAINAMILSLVYKSPPEDVRLIMVDPKMLELSVYEGIPHLLTPVVTDMKEAANALRWCVGEMERRYRLMSQLGVRNIAGYNKKVEAAIAAGEPIVDPLYQVLADGLFADSVAAEIPTLEKLPYIVVVIDELADMMMVVGKKVEELIARLAQKARAAGIHLLLATQRPSVDVLTGLIKANIPTRMAFKVSARVDSRTVLDQMGAEHLLGHGDMLYLPPGGSIPQRVHGAFMDDHEVHRVVDFLKQTGTPEYIENVLMEPEEHLPGIDPQPRESTEDADPLFDEAVKIVTETRRASISGVQRRLKIGYNRSARMIEEMERIGIVGPAETNGNREVLAPPPPED